MHMLIVYELFSAGVETDRKYEVNPNIGNCNVRHMSTFSRQTAIAVSFNT